MANWQPWFWKSVAIQVSIVVIYALKLCILHDSAIDCNLPFNLEGSRYRGISKDFRPIPVKVLFLLLCVIYTCIITYHTCLLLFFAGIRHLTGLRFASDNIGGTVKKNTLCFITKEVAMSGPCRFQLQKQSFGKKKTIPNSQVVCYIF